MTAPAGREMESPLHPPRARPIIRRGAFHNAPIRRRINPGHSEVAAAHWTLIMISNRIFSLRSSVACFAALPLLIFATSSSSAAQTQSPSASTAPAAQSQPATGSATSSGALDPSKLPAVVATVNGKDVSKAELLESARGAQQRIASAGQTAPPANSAFYNQVLDRIIGGMLLYQESQAQGTEATDQEAQNELAALEKRVNNPDTFNQLLQKQNMTRDDLQQTLKEDLSIQKYVQEKIVPAVQVSDAEAKAFYDQNADKMKRPERVQVSHILVRVPQDATDAQKAAAKKKAEDLLQQIKSGADFAELAKSNSDDPGSKPRGGDLGWISRGQTVKPFEDAAFALKPQQVSDVVESPFGYHIIKQTAHQDAGAVSFEEAKPRIVDFLKQQKVDQAVQAKVQALMAKAKIQRFI